MGALLIFDLVIFVIVVGEELGWRELALPGLLQQHSAFPASLILGVLWSAWHLPTFLLPATPQYGKSIIAFVLMTTAYSVLLCWIYLHTAGSVLVATLVHGAINLFQGIFLGESIRHSITGSWPASTGLQRSSLWLCSGQAFLDTTRPRRLQMSVRTVTYRQGEEPHRA